jgi:hypothetical protein
LARSARTRFSRSEGQEVEAQWLAGAAALARLGSAGVCPSTPRTGALGTPSERFSSSGFHYFHLPDDPTTVPGMQGYRFVHFVRFCFCGPVPFWPAAGRGVGGGFHHFITSCPDLTTDRGNIRHHSTNCYQMDSLTCKLLILGQRPVVNGR